MDYNKLLEKARKVYAECVTNAEKRKLESVFPELAESEDEKIRKEMIAFLQETIDNVGESPNKWTMYNAKKWVAWLEKQGERKPTDKVEPKFKVGDWIVYNDTNVYQVKEIDYTNIIPRYELENIDRDKLNIPFTSDYNLRNWTIDDAKDGDVLAAHECLVLFREIDGLNIKCHCTYHFMNHESFFMNTLQNKTAFQPATKEQRELLFQKMKEAGYEWDAENKELKKIERKPSEVRNETKNKCPNYSEGYGCSISPLKQCDTCPDYKLYNH